MSTSEREIAEGVAAGPAPVPLSRNRGYTILWSTMFLSELASEIVFIAFPLLLLAHGASGVEVGLLTSLLAAARMVANVPAGVLADRWDRRKIMLVSQAVRCLAMASLVGALFAGVYSFPHLALVAVLEGVFSSVFQPAEHAALPQVVPASQLREALSRNAARPFAALLLGPALAGFAFGLHELAPFSIDTALMAGSFAVLWFLRLPRGTAAQAPPEAGRPGWQELLGGFRWLMGRPVIRTTAVWIIFVNLAFHALIIVILVVSGEAEVGHGEMGLMMACFGAGGLLGAAVAGRLHAALRAPVIIIGSSWAFVALALAMAAAPGGIVLGVLLGAAAAFLPVATTTIVTYQLSITPDELRGRLSGVVGLCADLAGTIGPMAGGLLVALAGGAAESVLLCAAILGAVALGATISPTLRRFPTFRDQ
ncbi:MFS transporter [Nonomuraea candida]|uniref:MFS transporter n=1 Tax=Nonomuraea candida TaxID=359159 RepID=UPI0006948282|nr:MFS transporter [Nonomuraea candida]